MQKRSLAALGVIVAAALSAGCSNGTADDGRLVAPVSLSPWARSYPGTINVGALASGEDGSVLLGGTLLGTTDFGGGQLETGPESSVFLAYLDPAGNHRLSGWTGTEDTLSGAAVGPFGDLYLTGSFTGDIGFGSGTLTSGKGGHPQGYLVSFAQGNIPDHSLAIPSKTGTSHVDRVAATPDGDVIVAARADDTTDFGGGTPDSPSGASQLVIAAYSRQGTYKWETRIDDRSWNPAQIAVDHDGNVVFASLATQGPVTWGGVTVHVGSYVGKISRDGEPLWLQGCSANVGELPNALAVGTDAKGDVYLGGTSPAGFSIGGVQLPPPPEGVNGINRIGYLVKMNADGEVLRTRAFITQSSSTDMTFAFSDSGETVVAASGAGGVDFGAGLLWPRGNGVVLARLSPDGKVLRQMILEDHKYAYVSALAIDPTGKTVAAGGFSGALDVSGAHLESTGDRDLWVARLDF
jgi:hypothetical protein